MRKAQDSARYRKPYKTTLAQLQAVLRQLRSYLTAYELAEWVARADECDTETKARDLLGKALNLLVNKQYHPRG